MFLYLLSLLVIALCLRKYLSQTNRLKYGDNIPGPRPLPLIGNGLEIGISPKVIFQNLQRLTKEYGAIYRIWLGPQLVVFIADPSYVEQLTGSTKHMDKASIYSVMESVAGRSLLLISGEEWKRHWKIIAPTFSGPLLAQFLETFNSYLDVLLEKLSEHQNGPSFDIFPLMSLYTMDIISESSLGWKLNAMVKENSELVQAINGIEDTIFRRMSMPWLHPDWIFRLSPLGRRQAKYLDILLPETEKIIETQKQNILAESTQGVKDKEADGEQELGIKRKRIFLDEIIHQVQKGAKLDNKDILHEVNAIAVGGHYTISSSISFTCWLLAKHQDVQDKVVLELKHVFGDSLRHATMQQLNELKYLEQVIKESLRMFPPIPAFARRLSEDIITDKYVIPAGIDVAVNVVMLHRHPEHFPDPERFNPDRFLPENCTDRHPYAFIPFGAGPRTCIGLKYAMLEMKTTMSKLLRHFRIFPPENPFQELDLSMQMILKSQNGVPIKLRPRKF